MSVKFPLSKGKEKEQARVDAARKAKAWRKAKALQDILARQTADKLALAKKAAQAVALAIAQQRKLQEDQGQPPIAVHTTGLLPPRSKKGGPLKALKKERHEAWLKTGKDKAAIAAYYKAREEARSAQTLMGRGKIKKHHVVLADKVVQTNIEHQPTWVHEHVTTNIKHVEPYTFTPFTYNEEAFARFEGRRYQAKPSRVTQPLPQTTHALAEMPPHVAVSTEQPLAQELNVSQHA